EIGVLIDLGEIGFIDRCQLLNVFIAVPLNPGASVTIAGSLSTKCEQGGARHDAQNKALVCPKTRSKIDDLRLYRSGQIEGMKILSDEIRHQIAKAQGFLWN